MKLSNLGVGLISVCLAISPAWAQEQDCDDGSIAHPMLPDGFIDGDYILVGREPAGKAAYHGRARIESKGCAVVVHRRIGDRQSTVRGGWQKLEHPQGAFALEFRSRDGAAHWSCQVSVDLDNYARLTCFRILAASPDSEPGLEVFFPTATWPDSMPGKHFR